MKLKANGLGLLMKKKKPKYILCYFSSVILPLCLVKDYIAEDF